MFKGAARSVYGFVIAITGLIVSGVVAVYGSAIAGGVLGVGTLASLVGVFMYGSKMRSQERTEKITSGESDRKNL